MADDESRLIEDDAENLKTFRKDVILVLIKGACLIYFVLGIILSISVVSMEIGSTNAIEYSNNQLIYNCVNIFMMLCKIINIALMVYMKYVNYTLRNLIVSLPIENSQILYAVALPLCAASIIYVILGNFYNAKHFDYNTVDFITALFDILFYISIVILLIEVGGILNTGEDYHMKIINTSALFITLIGTINFTIYETTCAMLLVFENVTNKYYLYQYNFSFYQSENDVESEILYQVATTIRPAVICFGLVCFGYLVAPVRRHLLDIERIADAVNKEMISSYLNENVLPEKKYFSAFSLVLGVAVITISFTTFPIYYSMKTSSKFNASSIFRVVPIPIYVLSIYLTILQIKEVKLWKSVDDVSMIDQLLLWTGFVGVWMSVIASMTENFDCVINEKGLDQTVISSLSIVGSILCILLLFLQTVLIDFSIKKEPMYQQLHGAAKFLNPVFGLLCGNISLGLLALYRFFFVKSPENIFFSRELFQNLIRTLSNPLMFIYHIYSTLFFGKTLNSIHSDS